MVGAANVYFFHEGFICWSPHGTPGVRHWYMYGACLTAYRLVLTAGRSNNLSIPAHILP